MLPGRTGWELANSQHGAPPMGLMPAGLQVSVALAQDPLEPQQNDNKREQPGPAPQFDVGPTVDSDDPRWIEREPSGQRFGRPQCLAVGRVCDCVEGRAIADRSFEFRSAIAYYENVTRIGRTTSDCGMTTDAINARSQPAEIDRLRAGFANGDLSRCDLLRARGIGAARDHQRYFAVGLWLIISSQ